MIETTIFSSAHLDDLKKALTVYARRHRVTADNIANVETEGYRAQEYRFEEVLKTAGRRTPGLRTHPGHLPVGRADLAAEDGAVRPQAGTHDNGINNVDIDREMTSLATNELSYRLATRLLSMKYNLLRGAITGRVR